MSNLEAPVFVGSDAAKAVFRWDEAISALQAAYRNPIPAGAAPPRIIASAGDSWLRTLSAIPPGGRYFGTKLMGMARGAATPTVQYVIVLFDRETSRIAAFIDANLVTGLRTAATSAAALDRIAPPGPARLGVLGAGLEARMHVRAFSAIRPLSEVRVFSPTPARRTAFAESVTRDLGVSARAVDRPEAAAEGAQIVLTAARSRGEEPILYGNWLEDDVTIVSIGSTVPEQREIDVSVVARSDVIICDMPEEVIHETGDMIAAREAEIAFADKVFGLTDLMSGGCDAALNAARCRLFKSVGGGLQDIVVAELILTRAIAAGLTTPLPIAFGVKQ